MHTGPGPVPELGGHGGYDFNLKAGMVGAQASFPLSAQVEFYPSVDFYTISGQTEWNANINLRLRPPRIGFWYVGGGLNLLHLSLIGVSQTHEYANVLAGIEGQGRGFRPYIEGRLVFSSPNSAFQLVGGASFPATR